RVPRRNGDRSNNIARRGEIDQKGTDKNSGPNPITEEQQSGDCNSCGRPDRRGADMQKRELQTELADDKINERDNADERQRRETSRKHYPSLVRRISTALRNPVNFRNKI